MEKTAKSSGRGTAAIPSDRLKLGRALLLLTFFLVAAALAVFAVFGAKRLFFTNNERLTLRQVKLAVQRDGYWNGRENRLCRQIGLNTGTNLFAIDYAELRTRLLRVPNLEGAEVAPVLPDSVELRLFERVPRAVLLNPNSGWVVDEKGVAMPKSESMAADWRNLPVIAGVTTHDIQAGKSVKEAVPALGLLMAVLQGFPDINIRYVTVEDSDSLIFWISYQDKKLCRVVLPRRNRGMTFMLSALQSAIIDAWQHRDERSNFILSYNGQVLIKGRP